MSWKIIDKKLVRTFKLKDFNSIIQKLNVLNEVANNQNHHPDFEVFDYNEIRFMLFTHSENAITQADRDLATEIDIIFG